MRRRSLAAIALMCAVISLVASTKRSKKNKDKADVSVASAIVVNNDQDTVWTRSEIAIDDSAYVKDFVSILDFIATPSVNNTSVSGCDTLAETISVLSFLSSLGQVDSMALKSSNMRGADKLYTGKMPTIDISKFRRPVRGVVTSPFGPNPRRKTVHFGVDMRGRKGDTVVVALPGIVRYCGNNPKGYGLYVCVRDSAGIETRYAHLSKILVKKGDVVKVGGPVGLVGSTGNSTGPHLHFEMRYKDKIIDPTLFL